MKIDIISYTEEQYAVLKEEQILEIMNAQQKKDNLTASLAEKKRKEKYRLLQNGASRSKVYEKICAELEEKYLAEVDRIRERLLFFLRYSGKPSDEIIGNSPYPVDYSLSEAERFVVVKGYYMDAYDDPQERYDSFRNDSVAKAYLGELYPTLHDTLLSYIQ